MFDKVNENKISSINLQFYFQRKKEREYETSINFLIINQRLRE